MKKIFSTILSGFAIAALLIGCEDYNDQFKGLDDMTKPTNPLNYTYQLVDADYAVIGKAVQKPIQDQINAKQTALKTANHADSITLKAEIDALKLDPTYVLGGNITSKKYLTSVCPGTDYIPLFLASKYPYGDIGTSAIITYNYNPNDLSYLSNFTSATSYAVSDANYASIGGKVAKAGCFTPSYPAENYIPNLLPAGTEGKYKLVTYKTADVEPALADLPNTTTVFSENFEAGNLDNFVAFSVKGAQEWTIDATHGVGGSGCAKISGYASGNFENEDWLIIPSVDLSLAKVATLSFYTAFNYTGNDLVLKYSTNYSGSGDPTSATWNNLSFTISNGTVAWAWTSSGNVNIPGMPNANVSIAFVFTSTATTSKTWEIDDILLTYKDSDAEVPCKTYNNFYKYSNSKWAKSDECICIQPFEYALMGAPGVTNSFSSTIPPANYIPTYLKAKYPLSAEGDVKVVAYNYLSGSTTSLKADEYRFKSGEWTAYAGVISKTDPFVFGTTGWVFDPTVKLDMVDADYQLMVDYVLATPEISIFADPNYKNEEFYYGFSKRYLNVSFRLSGYRSPYYFPGKTYQQPASIDPELNSLTTNEEKSALLWKRLEKGMGIFVQLRFPDAVPQSNGVDVYYHVKVKVYYPDCVSNVSEIHKYIFKCTAAATGDSKPTFEFVSKEKV